MHRDKFINKTDMNPFETSLKLFLNIVRSVHRLSRYFA